ncbi:SGNH/GDSL hydrolase family protein [Neobacillus sp. OS1-33]|uniref:SGNH/GDSL hydrolase family protein n=1 Tax=Neobacillus sp. OS1-33 TaxID=3070683 RepID=UPI0027E143CB|nr:SGNH/GDSL hydrolase family protein [Neobacillus sp. OS1-33]WML24555.1 SGNH/GDSL hydrolase family protein [Neobacillus sp. OS1-33]
MKNLFTILLGIACITILFYGHSYWNQRITTASNMAPSTSDKQPSKVDTQTNENSNELLKLTRNWPSRSIDRFQQTLDEKKVFKLLFVGSPAMGSETSGAFPLVKEHLMKAFGQDHIQVTIQTFNSTSTQFIHNHTPAEIASEKADLIIFEPFIWLNNGEVLIEDSLKDATTFMDDIQTRNPETAFILQPAFPIYKAKIYPAQVEELKKFAKKNKITYIDHWSTWPNPDSKEIKDYLLPDQSAPSDKGNQLWSEYLTQFLISKSESE